MCPAGFECDKDTTLELVYPCATGYYSLVGSKECTICEVGYYCGVQFGNHVKCPSGTYQDEEGKDYCNQCEFGYTSDPAAEFCTLCAADE